MNINFGLIKNYNKREKDRVIAKALSSIAEWKKSVDDQIGS